tara:strand:- start:374 stop:568 length:195 start_codon:yes stop_codon:yes gene_type:complete
MALENKDVLANLSKQRDELKEQIENARVTLLKIEGAIDVLEQIEASKEEEVETTETEVVEGTDE